MGNEQLPYYVINGKRYPRVTTILSTMLPKAPELISWMKNTRNWEEIRDYKATIGTLGHDRILHKLSPTRLPPPPYDPADLPPDAREKCDLMEMMWTNLNLEIGHPRRVEYRLVNHDHKYAGTCDLAAPIRRPVDDELIPTVADLKSSKAAFTGHRLQVAAYWDTMGRVHDRAMIIALHPYTKDNPLLSGAIYVIERDELAPLANTFNALADAYNSSSSSGSGS